MGSVRTELKRQQYDATTKSTEPSVYCSEACQTTLRGLKHHHLVPVSRRYAVFVQGS
jgi:hypothetical protein